ncbi:MAG: thioredoxin family protein [Bacteroidetes bacterium]|nr:thioredoxin family protein [Bacteroidota bacterium]
MMKRSYTITLISLLLISANALFSQILDPVDWGFTYNKTAEKEYELIFTANIDDTWHLYSLNLPDGGPIPTSFTINESDHFELIGEVEEISEAKEIYDPSFDMNVKLFSDEAVFIQKVRLLTDGAVTITGSVEFMSCDDKRCLPPKDEEFIFKLESTDVVQVKDTETETREQDGNSTEYFQSKVDLKSGAVEETGAIVNASGAKPIKEGSSMLVFFFLSMLAGFAGILTPCVFPMIPMTVAFFSRGDSSRGKSLAQAFIFGLSIIMIYTSIGLIVSLTSAGADFASNLSTHWIPNLIFFLLFMVFAASFFGMFELVLPNKLINRADKQADKGGFIAASFMGLTTVLVSFSCTGPIIGALLVEAASGEVIKPTLGMFGFSVAFALPFTLFAIFPSWINNLPKSGGWLNSVKVVLGFIVLAFGLKFVSTIDQGYHLGIMSRDIFIALWIVIFSLMGLYLLGKIKFAHDSEVPFLSVPRLVFVIATFTFVVYLIPGLFGAQLKAVSGLLPPKTAQKFDLKSIIFNTSDVTFLSNLNEPGALCEEPEYADFLHLPHGLTGYFDYRQGLACAKALNKPVFLDFKGHACSNCKEMEAKVWSDPDVLRRLKENFIIVALYVDDRTKLAEEEWITSQYDGKIKKTIGKKNADFQISRFRTNTQPYHVILDHNENVLVMPMTFNLNIGEYIDFLDAGLEKFEEGE